MEKKSKPSTFIHPDFYYGLILFFIGLGFLIHTFNGKYQFDLLFGDVSTVFFPRVVLIIWIGLSIILILRGYFSNRLADDSHRTFYKGAPRLLLVLTVLVLTTFILWIVGLFLGGPILLIALGLAFGYRRLIILIPMGLILPFVIWYILGEVSKINLPTGLLWS